MCGGKSPITASVITVAIQDIEAFDGYISRSGRVVSASDCGVRGPRVRITPLTVVFIAMATAVYSLGHGLRTYTAVATSTQPSTLHGTVK